MPAKGSTVLVVEDDVDMREMVELTLSGAGYKVMTAGEGREALDKVALEMPKAIILDMKMPGMNGWEFAREFRAKYNQGVPIVVVTAAQAAEERAREIGADRFLDKPFEIDELIRVVEGMVTETQPQAPDEDTLVARAIKGDKDAFMVLYDRYYDRIYRHIYFRVGRAEDAEDLVQQVFLRAWSAIGRYEQRGRPFPAWLFTIAHNLVVSYYRSESPHYLDGDVPDRRSEGDPEQQAYAQFERERLLQALLKLRPTQQRVITMRFLENADYRQIAAAVGKSEVNVRVIQYRALQELRKILEEEDR